MYCLCVKLSYTKSKVCSSYLHTLAPEHQLILQLPAGKKPICLLTLTSSTETDFSTMQLFTPYSITILLSPYVLNVVVMDVS